MNTRLCSKSIVCGSECYMLRTWTSNEQSISHRTYLQIKHCDYLKMY